jgi:hypothetical protein
MGRLVPLFLFALLFGVPASSVASNRITVPVPEPSTTVLLLAAGAGVAAFRRLRKR